MNENIVEFVESSFLKPLLEIPNITDVSYNGSDIYYVTNDYGRQKYPQKIEEKIIYDFLRQIVNLTDSQFSFSKPILDVSIGRYRFNATHFAMTRKFREKAINFSLRIGYDGVRIHEDDGFINKKCLKLVDLFIKNKLSIVIGGKTGCGKTEFQKFLISRLKDNSRVIVIDNLNEIENDEFKPNLDIQTWVVNQMYEGFTFDNFIKNALRSHPDWIVLSESRGKEMLSILNSAMSGHPTITTLHTKDCKSIYSRMARMCLQSGDNLRWLINPGLTSVELTKSISVAIISGSNVLDGNMVRTSGLSVGDSSQCAYFDGTNIIFETAGMDRQGQNFCYEIYFTYNS